MVRILLIFLMTIMGAEVCAHQQKEAYSNVQSNPRTGKIEIMHRFYLHDAEHAIKELKQGAIDLYKSEVDKQWFADYVQKQVAIKQNDIPWALTPVGFEVEGKFFWVYQETELKPIDGALEIKMGALHDIWPKQVNHVNVEVDGDVYSVRINGRMDWGKINLPQTTK